MKLLNNESRVWAYIEKHSCMYQQIPYSLKHFTRVFSSDHMPIVSPTSSTQVKRIIERLVHQKKLIRVKNGEYMIHPSACNNRNTIYVEAFSK